MRMPYSGPKTKPATPPNSKTREDVKRREKCKKRRKPG